MIRGGTFGRPGSPSVPSSASARGAELSASLSSAAPGPLPRGGLALSSGRQPWTALLEAASMSRAASEE